MLSLHLELSGMSELTKTAMGLSGKYARAKVAAMKSVGWMGMVMLRNHIEYHPPEWAGLHPLTKKYYKKRGVGGRWVMRGRPPRWPDEWLGKFARYRVAKDGHLVQLDFGKGKKNKSPGRLDPELAAIARRVDGGETIDVTMKMRKKLAATYYRAAQKKKGGAEPVVGVDYFPLKKATRTLSTPPRPIFEPVQRKLDDQVGPWFEDRFWRNFYGRKET